VIGVSTEQVKKTSPSRRSVCHCQPTADHNSPMYGVASPLRSVDGAPPGKISSQPPDQWSSMLAKTGARWGGMRLFSHSTFRSATLSINRKIFAPASGKTSTAIHRFSRRTAGRPR